MCTGSFQRLFARGMAVALTIGFFGAAISIRAAEYELTKGDDGVTVAYDGALVTRYLVKSGAKPILWPVIGSFGKEVTRAYPMRNAGPHERDDHIHQRSFWFTHGDVNGVSFWHEMAGGGQIVHREFTKAEGGNSAVIAATNDWVAPGGEIVLTDERTLTFGRHGLGHWIDFDITLHAPQDKPVVFGDTKEGSFGIRTAGTMKVDQKLGGKITNQEGLTDAAAWGKRSAWVDYTGPVEGNIEGIAILNHPSSFRFPSYWHVRTYGLFAANPWGVRDFTGDKNQSGAHTLPAGKSLALHYRVYFHKGETKEGMVAEAYEEYAKMKK